MNKGERTKQYIIEKSAPLFNAMGIAGTSITDVMKITGMAKGGLYGNFETKEDLAYAIVDYNLHQLLNIVMLAVGKEESAKGKLFAFLDVFKKPVLFPVDGGCPILNFGAESDDSSPIVREKVKAAITVAQSNIAAIIRQGIENGEFNNSLDAHEFSILMFSAIEGGILIGRVLKTNRQMSVIIKMMKQMIGDNLL